MPPFSLVWLPVPPSVELLASLGVKESMHVPMLLTGAHLERFQRTGEIALLPVPLMLGTLYGLSDPAPGVDRERWQARVPEVLAQLTALFDEPSVEQLILNAAAKLRDDVGSWMAARVLRNGLTLCPDSQPIRCDCVTDTWMAAEVRREPDTQAVMQELVALLRPLRAASLAPKFRKLMAYIATVAFTEAAPEEKAAYLEAQFTDADRDWDPEEREQIATYARTGVFSWEALGIH